MKLTLVFLMLFSISNFLSAGSRLDDSTIRPLKMPKINQPLADLGKILFNDKNISYNKNVSCHSCHLLNKGGADGQSRSVGDFGDLTGRNSPTVFNTSAYRLLMWDGRMVIPKGQDLAAQFKAVIKNKKVMGWTNHTDVVDRISSDKKYKAVFLSVFDDDEINLDRLAAAVAEYQLSLTAINSPFDLWLKEEGKVNDDVIKGYGLFTRYGCTACHYGPAVGGYSQQRLGVYDDPEGFYKTLRNDKGLYKKTKNDDDLFKFRVPSLRFAYYTAPYMHDGSIETLDDAIKFMGLYQRNIEIPALERGFIAEFIKSLAGDIPKE